MKRGGDGGGGPPRKKGGGKGKGPGAPKGRYAFKALCSDSLAAGLLGTRGAKKDEIQQETGVKLVFSNRDDYFPDTKYRVLGMYADDPEQISRTFELLIPKLQEAGDEEKNEPQGDGPHHLGKEPGEYCFRFVVTRRMASSIIGNAGSNIKHIRQETGAHLFVDNNTVAGHRMVRAIGLPDAIIAALRAANGYVQEDADKPEYEDFAKVVNFHDAIANGWEPQFDADDKGVKKGGKGGKRDKGGGKNGDKGGGKRDKDEGGGGYSLSSSGWKGGNDWPRVETPPPKPKRDGPPKDLHESAEQGLHALADVIRKFPGDTASVAYSVACEFSYADTETLEDTERSGDFLQEVKDKYSTEIDFDDGAPRENEMRIMTIVGPLLSIYASHSAMMKRLADVEAEARAAEEEQWNQEGDEGVAAMKAKIAELTAQLAAQVQG